MKTKVKDEIYVLEELLKHYKIIDNLKEQSRSFLVAVHTIDEINELKKILKEKG